MPVECPSSCALAEKQSHYIYLKEFRTQQCPDFLQRRCTHHRPFACFNWHYLNQRRRRPVRKRDGTFNYSSDVYCLKYDETTGSCPEGDSCSFLHPVVGDVERKFHYRYFKTCACMYDVDVSGICLKNGVHCPYAHGAADLRAPVFDSRDVNHVNEEDPELASRAFSILVQETYFEDPAWDDPLYVLINYKTEPCQRPHRLCRQGYACPSYHSARDKRRSPVTHKYRSTPCSLVKPDEEWGELSACEAGENCGSSHTRTEQQFHPEVYKSTVCNDVMQHRYCPRGMFYAFAHSEDELHIQWEIVLEGKTKSSSAVVSGTAEKQGGPPPGAMDSTVDEQSASVTRRASGSEQGESGNAWKAPGVEREDAVMLSKRVAHLSGDITESDGLPRRRAFSLSFGMTNSAPRCVVPHESPLMLKSSSVSSMASKHVEDSVSHNDTCETVIVGDDARQRLSEDVVVFHQHAAMMRAQNNSDVANSGLLADGAARPMLDSHWQHQQLLQLRAELPAIDSRIAHLRILMDLARSACEKWRVDAECCTAMVSRLNDERQQAAQQADELMREFSSIRPEVEMLLGVPYLRPLQRYGDLQQSSFEHMQHVGRQLQSDLDCLAKILSSDLSLHCATCKQPVSTVVDTPCQHCVLCPACASESLVCPVCEPSLHRTSHWLTA